MFNVPAAQLLIASIIAGIIGISGVLIGEKVMTTPVDVTLEPAHGSPIVGEIFVATLKVKSSVPVNVFGGLLEFDSSKLVVTSIDYNTSIANLWAEKPWYSNGDGTINFSGGTTATGGFIGEGTLITITFTAKSPGEALVKLTQMRVLRHDGVATDAEVRAPIDALFTVESTQSEEDILFDAPITGPKLIILQEAPDRDLNDDGKQSMADFSIFMTDLATQNLRSDFNKDGQVNIKDLSILTN